MNTNAYYARRTDRTLGEVQAPTTSTPETSPLAIHGDPTQATTTRPSGPGPTQRSIAWVRPSELPTVVGAPWVRRGVDLQAELARRTRRAPASATSRAGRRITRTAIGRPEPASPTAEGLGL